MSTKELADLIFPNITKTMTDYEMRYPKRELPEGAVVTRFSPSPTGFVHIGSLYAAFINAKLAKQTNGIFYLRIEDTDKKREVENAVFEIVRDLNYFDIFSDEGALIDGTQKGNYGPYIQSEREEIYQTIAKQLIIQGNAYPCFASEEELDEIRTLQEGRKARIGYYGRYAKYRGLSPEEAALKIKEGLPFIIRLKSPGVFENQKKYNDLVKGEITFPENDLDLVIIKSDGLPTYHFAHVVDDYFMRTTHVVRGDEWVSSLPIHLQLFEMIGAVAPSYGHFAPFLKEENGGRRKLSKRKDPEAAVSFYHELGIPKEALLLYLATIANSNFELWLEENPDKGIDDFTMEFSRMSTSGSLFDLEKLYNISKNYISKLSAEEVYTLSLEHAQLYDPEFVSLLTQYQAYVTEIFNIERTGVKVRKDYVYFSDIKNQIWYLFDELFTDVQYEFKTIDNKEEIISIATTYLTQYYDSNDTKEVWFAKMKELSAALGYAAEVKEYKKNPELFKGHVGDISMVLRVVMTSRSQTPDLYEIMKLLGKDRMQKRIMKYQESVNESK